MLRRPPAIFIGALLPALSALMLAWSYRLHPRGEVSFDAAAPLAEAVGA